MTTKTKAQELADLVNGSLGKGTVSFAADKDYAVTYTSTGLLPFDILFQGGMPSGRFVEVIGDYCVTPETKVLTDALTWVPAGDLSEGYGLVGFDEQVNQGRGKSAKLKPAELQRMGEKRMECIRIITDKGEITVSRDHGFVMRDRRTRSRVWIKAKDIEVGDDLVWTAEPWESKHHLQDARDMGYLAGLIDGEGWMDGSRVQFGQNPGVVLNEYTRLLDKHGFSYVVAPQGANNVQRVGITGGRWEHMRFLGQTRPARMMPRSTDLWVGADLTSKGPNAAPGGSHAIVLAVEPVGMQDIVQMQTSSRTFLANGFATHNSTLKSYLGLCSIVQVQQKGGTAAIIDTEHAFDPAWAESVGVDLSSLIVERPENGELAMDIMEALVRGGIDMIVVDSIAATLPAAEQEKRFHGEKVQPGRLAYLMSVALRKITTANTRTSILWINQTRLNIGVTFGSPLAVPGGKAMPYYASYRVEIKKVGKETVVIDQHDGEKWVKGRSQVGQKFKAEVLKSKLSRPFRDVLFTWNLNENSIDIPTFLISQGLEAGLISLKGNTWSYGETKAVGREKFRTLIASEPALQARLENDVRMAHDLPLIEVPEAPVAEPVKTTRKRPTKRSKST